MRCFILVMFLLPIAYCFGQGRCAFAQDDYFNASNNKSERTRYPLSEPQSNSTVQTELRPPPQQAAPANVTAVRRPNIVLIVADDMGFADMGMYGGEIRTPNLDELAQRGVRFTNFYTAPTCSPSRSMLLSGTDNHIAGLGNMDEMLAPNQRGVPGYEGVLNDRVVAFPELLRLAGYHTYMTGKWHLGKEPDKIPAARGFECDFSMMQGGGSYFDDTGINARSPKSIFTHNGRYVTQLPKNFYATKTYTDKMIEFIESNRGDGKPFFAYVSHQAPHDPFGLPNEWLRRYEAKYDQGWDVTKKQRLKRMIEMGIIPEGTQAADRMWFVPEASILAPGARAMAGRHMELYAAMVENMDCHIGRLMQHLKSVGEFDNTLFIFHSDNGPEGADLGKILRGQKGSETWLFHAVKWSQTDPSSWGRPGSYSGVDASWAQVSATPFRLYKGWLAEGGIRAPLVISGAGVGQPAGSINHGLMHIMDIAPTLLEIAGVVDPSGHEGWDDVAPIQGKSWLPMLSGWAESPRGPEDWLGWELWGNRAIRKGDWKILWMHKPMGIADWELFNLRTDPSESQDLSDKYPEKKTELLGLWDEYVRTNNVIIPDRHMFETWEDTLPLRVPVDEGWPPMNFKRPFVPPKELTDGGTGR
jgi:arylsulfatase A-like enzyme